jgi:hypothetical protein
MKKLTSLIAAALTIAACGPAEDPAAQYRDALPKSAAVQLGVPDSSAGAGANALAVDRAAVGDSPLYQSEWAVQSFWLAVSVNWGVKWTLDFLQFVTAFPPSSCDDVSCTWGPWLGDEGLNFYKMHVEKVDGAYVYALSGQPANDSGAPYVDLIAGTAYPGADRDHGNGSFTIDFDAQDYLQHATTTWKQDYGTIDVEYDNTSDLVVRAVFLGAKNRDSGNSHDMNAVYDFVDSGAGGTLQVRFENLDTDEAVALRTRWDESGAGRADVNYSAPGPVAFEASECWAGKAYFWAETYDSKYGHGVEANCVFSPALYADVEFPAQ